MLEKGKYSVVVPVYNEPESIMETYSNIRKSSPGAQIIFVDDGSTDGSVGALEDIGRRDGDVLVLRHRLNMGYGAALKTGIRASDTEVVVVTDADGTYPNDRIHELVGEIGDCDMVVGARTGAGIPLLRRPAKWIIGRLANYLSGTMIPDLNSGLRAMRREVVRRFLGILPDGFSFTTTITLAMLTNGCRVKYLPIEYFRRKGRSKIRPIRDTLNFVQLIIRTVMYFNPLKVFLPLSLLLFVSGLGVFLYSLFFLERILDATTVILIIGAVQTLAIGMLADLIEKRGRG
jgi:glycosyltransferase involved in cell wall biosynthesis